MEKLTFEDIRDILVGCTILSTGGGGDLQKGLKLVEEDFKSSLEYRLVSLDEIDDDAVFTSPYFCGAIGPQKEDDSFVKYKKIGQLETVLAVQALERHLGMEISGVVSIEYGGMNTAVAMSTGARLKKFIVDADGAGRAVPDLQFSTFYVAGIPIYSLAVANKIGDVAVFQKVADDFRAEDLVRALATVSGGMIGMTDHPCMGKDLKKSVIPNALSYAREVGKAQRTALDKGKNPINEIIAAGDGFHLFDGKVKKDTEWKIEGGFTYGTIEIEGVEKYRGHSMRIWFKNENIICWLDEEVFVTAPDLICVVETANGYPVTNPYCKKDMNVSVLGFKAPEIWRTEKGLSILNPRFFGFDVDYMPIEKKFLEGLI
ncbi:MAG: DUF917 domain-containing protein [Bacillota bacterium]